MNNNLGLLEVLSKYRSDVVVDYNSMLDPQSFSFKLPTNVDVTTLDQDKFKAYIKECFSIESLRAVLDNQSVSIPLYIRVVSRIAKIDRHANCLYSLYRESISKREDSYELLKAIIKNFSIIDILGTRDYDTNHRIVSNIMNPYFNRTTDYITKDMAEHIIRHGFISVMKYDEELDQNIIKQAYFDMTKYIVENYDTPYHMEDEFCGYCDEHTYIKTAKTLDPEKFELFVKYLYSRADGTTTQQIRNVYKIKELKNGLSDEDKQYVELYREVWNIILKSNLAHMAYNIEYDLLNLPEDKLVEVMTPEIYKAINFNTKYSKVTLNIKVIDKLGVTYDQIHFANNEDVLKYFTEKLRDSTELTDDVYRLIVQSVSSENTYVLDQLGQGVIIEFLNRASNMTPKTLEFILSNYPMLAEKIDITKYGAV